jgi:UDP-N-acetylmuramate--alanine ligase
LNSCTGEANAVGGGDPFFVIEADEYDGAFLGLNPALAIVTNVEFDHPDKFRNMQDVQVSFARFMHRVRTG